MAEVRPLEKETPWSRHQRAWIMLHIPGRKKTWKISLKRSSPSEGGEMRGRIVLMAGEKDIVASLTSKREQLGKKKSDPLFLGRHLRGFCSLRGENPETGPGGAYRKRILRQERGEPREGLRVVVGKGRAHVCG